MKHRGMRATTWLIATAAVFSSAAIAGEFTEGGAALWSQRVEGFVGAVKNTPEGESAQTALGQACEGVYGEMFKYGMYKTQVPNHASAAVRSFCRGIDALNGKEVGRVKECVEFRDARKQFARIEGDEAPQRVTALAGYMVKLLDSMLEKGGQAGWRGC